MAGPITAGVVECKIYGQITETEIAQKRTVNVFHYYQIVPNPALPDMSSLLTTFTTQVVQPMVALLHQDYKTIEIGARWMDQHTNPESVSVIALQGAKSGDRLPSYACFTVQLKTNLRGRSYRGSKHIGPIAEADTKGDEIDPAAVAPFKAWAAVLVNNMVVSGQSLGPCVLSRRFSQLQKDPVTIQAAAITAQLSNLTLGTLRKRREKTTIA